MEKGKVQTNDQGTNVLVETDSSSNDHWHHSDFDVECSKMTNEEIKEAFKKHAPMPIIEVMKNILMGVEGFAVSNCASDYFSHNDLFTFKRI